MSTPLRNFQQIELPYHIYNRGNRKAEIFLDTKDYQRFLKRLKEYKEKYAVEILCYCLMPNHFHFILRQTIEESIPKFMLALCTSYSKYFNIKHEQVGRLYQERYRAKTIDTDEYLLHLSRYIHLNPVSEEIENLSVSASTPGVERIHNYPWSSHREYLRGEGRICNTKIILKYLHSLSPHYSYKSFVESGIPEKDREFIAKLL